jgi:hypothetical protein
MIAYLGFLFILLVVGHASLAFVGGRVRRPFCEWLALTLGLGISVSGMVFLLLSIAGFPPTAGLILSVAGIAAVATIVTRDAWPTWRWDSSAWPAWALLGGGLAVIIAYVLRFGNFEWDGYMLWGMKARIVAHAALGDAHTIWDPHYAALHPNYPLHFPFIMGALYNLSGSTSDVIPKLIAPIYWLAMALALSATLRGQAARTGLLVAWALMAPSVLRWSASGNADLPLAALHAGAILCLLRWMEENDTGALRLLAIFAAALVCTKNEGTPVVALMLVVIAVQTKVQSRSWRPLLQCLGILTALLLPWFLFRDSLPVWDENYPGHLRATHFQDNLARIPIIVKGWLNRTLLTPQWNGLWHVLILLVIVAPRRACQPRAVVLWILLVGQLGAYSMAYLIGPIDPADLVINTGDRLLNHLVPLLVLLVGQQLGVRGEADSVVRQSQA